MNQQKLAAACPNAWINSLSFLKTTAPGFRVSVSEEWKVLLGKRKDSEVFAQEKVPWGLEVERPLEG